MLNIEFDHIGNNTYKILLDDMVCPGFKKFQVQPVNEVISVTLGSDHNGSVLIETMPDNEGFVTFWNDYHIYRGMFYKSYIKIKMSTDTVPQVKVNSAGIKWKKKVFVPSQTTPLKPEFIGTPYNNLLCCTDALPWLKYSN